MKWYMKYQQINRSIRSGLILFILILVFVSIKVSFAEDWPGYQKDNLNSGGTNEALLFPLQEKWQFVPLLQPNPAWPAPAKADFWHEKVQLDPRVTYDRAYLVAAVGDKIYFATSSDNKIYCLDALTGKLVWDFYTEAPNRIAPTVYKGHVYVGSDDGYLYCLDAIEGTLNWKYSPVDNPRRIPGNGRIISVSPIRTSVLIDNDILYLVAGLLPMEGVYLCALKPDSGEELYKKKQTEISPQGYPVLYDSKLYVPNSRSQPSVIDLKTGTHLTRYSGSAGAYLSFAGDALVYGTQDNGQLAVTETNSDDPLTFALSGLQFVAKENLYIVASENMLTAIDENNYRQVASQKDKIKKQLDQLKKEIKALREKRKKAQGSDLEEIDERISDKVDLIASKGEQLKKLDGNEFIWEQSIERPYSMILTGNDVVLGMENKIAAYDLKNGIMKWSASAPDRVYGLAAAKGSLYASTAAGTIHCFSTGDINDVSLIGEKQIDEPFAGDKVQKRYAATAKHILKESGIKKGYCLVLDCGEGRLAYELARRSDMTIIGIEKNARVAEKARRTLDQVGLLGDRISIFTGDLKDLNFTNYLANLIVSDKLVFSDSFSADVNELYRILRPSGGLLYLGQLAENKNLKETTIGKWFAGFPQDNWEMVKNQGLWAQIKRGNLEGSGEWTHLYANAANTASTTDELVSDENQTLWFGRPGPRQMTDRHHRHVSPLFKNGILYIPGDNRIIAADAYNGAILWNNTVDNFRRLAAPRDASNMSLTDDYLYAAAESRCYGFDPKTGEQKREFVLPQLVHRQTRYWGYLATSGDQLFGSGRKPEAAYTLMSKQEDFEIQWGDNKALVTSDYLFSMNRFNRKVLWTYKKGVILHSSIAIGNNRVYFIENRDQASEADLDGLIDLKTFLGQETYLVALDSKSGNVLWETKFDFTACQHVLFLSYSNEKLLALGSKNKNNQVWYDLYGFDAASGVPVWHQEQNNEAGIGGDHGEQIRHPVVASDKVFAEPYCYDLHTGEKDPDFKLNRGGGGCGTISGSPHHLFFRAANPAMCNVVKTTQGSRLNLVSRPGCWINIIPAGGLILIPEASSGCTCNFPLQMSVAYMPKSML